MLESKQKIIENVENNFYCNHIYGYALLEIDLQDFQNSAVREFKLDDYNNLKEDYNDLKEDYNNLKEDYNELLKEYRELQNDYEDLEWETK